MLRIVGTTLATVGEVASLLIDIDTGDPQQLRRPPWAPRAKVNGRSSRMFPIAAAVAFVAITRARTYRVYQVQSSRAAWSCTRTVLCRVFFYQVPRMGVEKMNPSFRSRAIFTDAALFLKTRVSDPTAAVHRALPSQRGRCPCAFSSPFFFAFGVYQAFGSPFVMTCCCDRHL